LTQPSGRAALCRAASIAVIADGQIRQSGSFALPKICSIAGWWTAVSARIHQSLCVTPAMEAGISDHVWTLEEIAGLIDSCN